MNAGVMSPPLAAEKTQATAAQLRGLGDKPASRPLGRSHTLLSAEGRPHTHTPGGRKHAAEKLECRNKISDAV